MRFVSQFLKRVAYPALHRGRVLKYAAPAGGCAVVNYHGVFPALYGPLDPVLDGNLVSQAHLRQQLRFLKAHYSIITPQEFRDWIGKGNSLPPRAVLLTCDDGLRNQLDDMLPILGEEHVECLFFVTAGACSPGGGELWYEEIYRLMKASPNVCRELHSAFGNGQSPDASTTFHSMWWEIVRRASRFERNQRSDMIAEVRARFPLPPPASEGRWRFLTSDQLLELANAGMTIGAHTMSHPVLAECTPEASYEEIYASKVNLERLLDQTIWAFAYPFGNPATMSDREVKFAGEAGFECAFLNVGGGFSARSEQFAFQRTHVTADMSVAELEAHMTGFHTRLQKLIRG